MIAVSFRFVVCFKEFNLIAISYWLFIGDVGSLIGLGASVVHGLGQHGSIWSNSPRSSLISYLRDWLVT